MDELIDALRAAHAAADAEDDLDVAYRVLEEGVLRFLEQVGRYQ